MRNQGNLKMTLLTLLPSIVLLSIAIFTLKNLGEYPHSLLGYFLLVFSIVLIIIGILFLIRYIITKRVQFKGKDSECTVIGFSQARSRYRTYHFLKVSYQGESGKSHVNKVEVSLYDLERYPVGTKLNCKVLGENCFVDRNWLTIVRE